MSFAPPPHITELLKAIGRADARRIRRAGRQVRRMGRQLPQFDSIWLDALAQCGVITRWQAGEIAAGRGASLKVGPYAVTEPLADCLYARAFRARHIESGHEVRLIVDWRDGRAAQEAAARLRELVEAAAPLYTEDGILPIAAGQVEQDSTPPVCPVGRPDTCRPAGAVRLWIAADWAPGRSAADWLVAHGRMPAVAVEEIARTMVAELAQLETAGLCHGDIATSNLWLADDGRTLMPLPGVRGVLRPEEGYSLADLPPEAFDYLAPERVAQGTPPSMAADLYACGCVWWHLLCGRAPLGGGDSLAKLRAAHEADITDPRTLAPDTPTILAEALLACTRPEPHRRPKSAAEIAGLLGSPTAQGGRALRRALRAAESPRLGWPSMRAPIVPKQPRRLVQSAAIGLALTAALLIAAWPIWRAVQEKKAESQAPSEIAQQTQTAAQSGDSPTSPGTPSPNAASKTPDRKVVPAAYLSESDETAVPSQRDANAHIAVTANARPTADLPMNGQVLDPAELQRRQPLTLRPGQLVTGANGARLQWTVPATGLRVTVDDAVSQQPIVLEGIDFVWNQASATEAAMIVVECGNVRLENCTFTVQASATGMPTAVRWSHPPAQQADTLALPSGSIRFTNCVFQNVAAALECRAQGAVRVEFVNSLHLGPGPLVHSPQEPRAEDSINLVLQQVTLRGASALWQCRVESSAGLVSGRVLVRAERSVFAPAEGGTLVLLHGGGDPEPLLRNLTWEGEGALVTPGISVATQRRSEGAPEPLDDSGIPIAGLVLSEVEFAGPTDGGLANHRLLRWNAPLRTADAPGCDFERIPDLPKSRSGS